MFLIHTKTVLDAILLLGLETGGDCVGCELSAIGWEWIWSTKQPKLGKSLPVR